MKLISQKLEAWSYGVVQIS